jgi:3-deoxy-D-arabino-heptulosonate 7-phosphate (DAHP) synthase class II
VISEGGPPDFCLWAALGFTRQLLDQHLSRNYQTTCDPRLKAEQSVELAFELAELLLVP